MRHKLLNNFWLRVGMIVAVMTTALAGTAWAQSNYSTDYTGNVTLSTDGGTNASVCDITISSNTYDGIKAGTSKKSAAVIMTVPSGTKYLHVHVAAWNNESSTTLSVSPSTNASPSSFILVPDAGIQGSGTSYTLNSTNASTSYYKVITFTTALTSDTQFTFSSSKRFVIWGVTAESEGSTPLADSNLALTGSTSLTFDLYNNSAAQTVSYTTSSTGAVTVSESEYVTTSVSGNTITVTPVKVTPSTQTITVNQAADDTYKAGSKTFTVSITDSTPFSGGEVTFVAGTDVGTTTGNNSPDAVTKSGVTMSSTDAAFATEQYRFYANSTTTFSVPEGYYITSIVITSTASETEKYGPGLLSGDGYTYEGETGTWTGVATSVTLTASAQVRATQIVVTVVQGTPKQQATVEISATELELNGTPATAIVTTNGPAVTLSTSDETVATVSGTTVTAVGAGSATITATWEENETFAAGSKTFNITVTDNTPVTSDWVLTDLSALTASDIFVIVGNNGDTFAMSNINGTTSAPAAVAVTVSGNYLTSDVADNIKWNISGNATNGYTFYPNGDDAKWLYCINNNNGLRVGTGDSKTFVMSDNYLYNSGQGRYIGIYSSQDWRSYTSINTNIQDQTFTFYKYVGAPLPAITAEDVEIAYNVTSGSISYEVENPVTGGTLTASTEDTWLDLGDVSAAAVPFTASANDNPIARTASVTLTYTYGTETATKTITVTQTGNPDAKGGANNPYTVTEALAVINSLADGGRTGKVYVTGTITAIGEVDTEDYFNATYTISDGTNNLLVYRGFYLNNAHFASNDQIKVEDNVVIYGQLLKFVKDDVTTPEIAQGNYIVSQTNNDTPTSITLNASGYATFASTSAVDFTNAETNGYSAWAVTGVNASGVINCVQITGAVAAGTGVLLKGTASAQVTIEYTTSGATLSDNKLEGVVAPKAIELGQYYGLKGNTFVKVNTGTVPASKALLPASALTTGVKTLTFNFDEDATAIKAIDNGQLTTDGVIYNVAGQRLSKMQKGINIVNGRKVLY